MTKTRTITWTATTGLGAALVAAFAGLAAHAATGDLMVMDFKGADIGGLEVKNARRAPGLEGLAIEGAESGSPALVTFPVPAALRDLSANGVLRGNRAAKSTETQGLPKGYPRAARWHNPGATPRPVHATSMPPPSPHRHPTLPGVELARVSNTVASRCRVKEV